MCTCIFWEGEFFFFLQIEGINWKWAYFTKEKTFLEKQRAYLEIGKIWESLYLCLWENQLEF